VGGGRGGRVEGGGGEGGLTEEGAELGVEGGQKEGVEEGVEEGGEGSHERDERGGSSETSVTVSACVGATGVSYLDEAP
jgi:hypothetical protein